MSRMADPSSISASQIPDGIAMVVSARDRASPSYSPRPSWVLACSVRALSRMAPTLGEVLRAGDYKCSGAPWPFAAAANQVELSSSFAYSYENSCPFGTNLPRISARCCQVGDALDTDLGTKLTWNAKSCRRLGRKGSVSSRWCECYPRPTLKRQASAS